MKIDPLKQWIAASSSRGIGCMECAGQRITHEVEGLGCICRKCIEKARECTKEGCEGISTRKMGWLCRDHYIGGDEPLCIDDFAGFRHGALAESSSMESTEYLKGSANLSADVTKAAKKIGTHKPFNWGWFPVAVKGWK